jgi:hypothetical protein
MSINTHVLSLILKDNANKNDLRYYLHYCCALLADILFVYTVSAFFCTLRRYDRVRNKAYLS